MPRNTTFKYHAFISYKRGEADEKYARWLQRKLEGFRIPTETAGAPDGGSPFDAKKFKVFLDKTDLGSHAVLNAGLEKSLGQCRNLIVVCSPRSAASPFVDDEVRFFQENGRAANIIPFIISGTPAPRDAAEQQCYPPSLSAEALGVTLAEGSREEALIKIVARLLGVDFSTLYQRHLRAQRRFMLIAMSGALAVLVLVSALAVWAVRAEMRATRQRLEAEELVRFMTFDLREEAFDYIPARARRTITDKVADYYAKWGASNFDSLSSLAAHLTNEALTAADTGDHEAAKRLYGRALGIQRDLDAERPGDPVVTANTVVLLNNLGITEMTLDALDEAGASYTEALTLAERLAREHPEHPLSGQRLADSLHVSSLYCVRRGENNAALQYAGREVELRRQLLAGAPEDPGLRLGLRSALGNLCGLPRPDAADAYAACEESLALAKDLHEDFPDNQAYQESLTSAAVSVSIAALRDDSPETAAGVIEGIRRDLLERVRKNPGRYYERALAGLFGTVLSRFKDEADRADLLEESRKLLHDARAQAPSSDGVAMLAARAKQFAGGGNAGRERPAEAEAPPSAGGGLSDAHDAALPVLLGLYASGEARGDVQGELLYSRKAVEHMEDLAEQAPDAPDSLFGLARAHGALAFALSRAGRYEEALAARAEAYQAACALAGRSGPSTASRDTALACSAASWLGDALRVEARDRDALAALEKAGDLASHVLEQPEKNADDVFLYATVLAHNVLYHSDIERHAAALKFAEIQRGLYKIATPSAMRHLYPLYAAQTEAITLACDGGWLEQAEAARREVEALTAMLPEAGRRDAMTRYHRCRYTAATARLALLQDDAATAKARLDEALALAGDAPANAFAVHWRAVAVTLARLRADIPAHEADWQFAVEQYAEALNQAAAMHAQWPHVREYRKAYRRALDNAADALAKAGNADGAGALQEQARRLRDDAPQETPSGALE